MRCFCLRLILSSSCCLYNISNFIFFFFPSKTINGNSHSYFWQHSECTMPAGPQAGLEHNLQQKHPSGFTYSTQKIPLTPAGVTNRLKCVESNSSTQLHFSEMWGSSHILEYVSRNGTKNWLSSSGAVSALLICSCFYFSFALVGSQIILLLCFILYIYPPNSRFRCFLLLFGALITHTGFVLQNHTQWMERGMIYFLSHRSKDKLPSIKNQTRECDTTKRYARRRLQQKGQVVFDSWLTLQVTNHRD